MILFHLGIEHVLEGLHLVKEDDLRKIHLPIYHHFVDVDAVYAIDMVP